MNRNAIARSRTSAIETLPPKLMLRQESLAPWALDGELHRHSFSKGNRRTQQLQILGRRFFLDASLFFASVMAGMESPHICREADDSYRGWSRWGQFMNPPRGGFFIADFIGREPRSEATSEFRFRSVTEGNARRDLRSAEAPCLGVCRQALENRSSHDV